MRRRFPDSPIVGVGAIVLAGDKILLVKRGNPPAKGIWSLPGGVVELGERLSEAVAREVMEETGIKITTGPLVKAVERIDRSEDNKVEYHYVILDFLCWGQYEKPRPLDDAADCCWSSVKDLTWARLDPLTTEVVEKALALV